MTNLGSRINSWDDLWALRGRAIHVVGAGSVEGAHLLLFLLDHGFTNLTGHDFSPDPQFDRAFKRVHVGWPMAEREAMLARLRGGVRLHFRDNYLEGIEDADAIAVTQGWYLYESNRPLLESELLQQRFFSLTQLYLALAPGPVLGVTGSQGKSTTTRLLGDILGAAGVPLLSAGNDRHGRQALEALETAGRETRLLLEISNRHLKMLERSPSVAVVTNVYPNHLEEHGGWDGYVRAKQGLVRYQHPGDIAVLNADLEVTRDMRDLTPAEVFWFGDSAGPQLRGGGGVALMGEEMVAFGSLAPWRLPVDALAVPGRHNAVNAAAAITAALATGVDPAAIERAVRAFRGLKHRIQFIWESDGVRFYDDLNSTTPTATAAALRTLGADVVWIFGGDDKGLDSSELAGAAADTVKVALALPGPGTDAIATELRSRGVEVEAGDDLAGAVIRAVKLARPGDRVLLSPACPGFFTRYYVGTDEDTGFKKLVREATLRPGAARATSPPARTPRK